MIAVMVCKIREKSNAFFLPKSTGIDLSWCSLSKASSCKAYKISNALTHVKTMQENKMGSSAKCPSNAKYAPMGASDKPSPKTK